MSYYGDIRHIIVRPCLLLITLRCASLLVPHLHTSRPVNVSVRLLHISNMLIAHIPLHIYLIRIRSITIMTCVGL